MKNDKGAWSTISTYTNLSKKRTCTKPRIAKYVQMELNASIEDRLINSCNIMEINYETNECFGKRLLIEKHYVNIKFRKS